MWRRRGTDSLAGSGPGAMRCSVDFDGAVDFADEEVGGVEADGPRREPECEHHE